jgi:hypothetical protein
MAKLSKKTQAHYDRNAENGRTVRIPKLKIDLTLLDEDTRSKHGLPNLYMEFTDATCTPAQASQILKLLGVL